MMRLLHWRRHGASAEGISSVYLAGRSASDGPQRGIGPSRSRIQKAGSEESQQAWTKAEGVLTSASAHVSKAPCRLSGRARSERCDQLLIRQATADDCAEY